MTALLYLLLLTFFLIETPLVIMMVFLLMHRRENGEVAKMRNILIIVIFVKFLFMLGQIFLIFFSLFPIDGSKNFIIWLYSILAIAICFVNWWAFFKIKSLLHEDLTSTN